MRSTLALWFLIGCAAESPRPVGPLLAGPAPHPAPTVSDSPRAEPASAEGDVRDQPVRTEPWDPEVFRDRRARLMTQMKTGLAVVLSAQRINYEAEQRQDADFLYLTGLADETGAAIILLPQEKQRREYLMLRAANPEGDRWTGYRATLPNRALEVRSGFARIGRLEQMGDLLARAAYQWRDLHFFGPLVGYQAEPARVTEIYSKIGQRVPGAHIKDSVGMIARMRMVKEAREIEKITRATDITVAGHLEAMRRVRPGMHEWELKQIVEDTFRRQGARRLAYGSIVGAGPDGCVLHYPNDDRTIGSSELILIDAGAEFDHYATDVTRTFPSNGKFTPEQRRIYEVVLSAQKAALAKLRPGARWEELEDTASKVIADAGYYDYFIHRLGHYVGLEVHDVGLYWEPIPEGAVLTIEPGIYMPGRKIGVRIEDTVLVTASGPRVLSEKIPREPDEIERWMATGR